MSCDSNGNGNGRAAKSVHQGIRVTPNHVYCRPIEFEQNGHIESENVIGDSHHIIAHP